MLVGIGICTLARRVGRKIPMLDLLIIQAAAVTLYSIFWFLVALISRRNAVADVAWGAGFIVLALAGQFAVAAISIRGLLSLTLVTIWGLRLWLHIGLRNREKSEDPRYRNKAARINKVPAQLARQTATARDVVRY
jgi:steroid 5-alpha reductase family enzyme